MSDRPSLDDYVDVATRVAEFRAKHPGGYLAPADPEHPYRIETVTGTDRDGQPVTQTFIVYVAVADDGTGRRGVGMAWEIFPGRTPYTRGSELMNAETSAWGRAIIAVLAADSRKGIASREEVRNRAAERDSKPDYDDRVAAGRMSRQQAREHAALARETVSGGRLAERVSGPAPDAADWETGSFVATTTDQQIRIGKLFDSAGIAREDRLPLAMSVLDLPDLRTSRDLSSDQAEYLITYLDALEQTSEGSA